MYRISNSIDILTGSSLTTSQSSIIPIQDLRFLPKLQRPIMSHLLRRTGIRRWLFNAVVPPKSNSFRRPLCDLSPENLEASWNSMEGLMRSPANYAPLTPISFLERAARVYGDRTSVVDGGRTFTWEETLKRCLKLASALSQLGICRGDLVATFGPNTAAMVELHFAAPMAGAVLCTLNSRHDSIMIAALLQHSEAKLIFVDHELLPVAWGAFDLLIKNNTELPILVLIQEHDDLAEHEHEYEYEDLLSRGDGGFAVRRPRTEWDPISVNYTSGTTSRPKGVVYNHRGAYLNALATTFLHGMPSTPVYLWTVPMFHCNGWCLIWGLAAIGGTNICLRTVSPKNIFDAILRHKVSHMGGAPTVLNKIINSGNDEKTPLPHTVDIMTGGSPPPPSILERIEKLGFRVSHLYGLTETYGPGTYCVWKPEWDLLPREERYRLKARQGVEHFALEKVDVRDSVTMESVPADGETVGEIMFRGNTVMSGYLKDMKATEAVFAGGWFRSGDLAVKHPDGYIEIKDRLKDIVISGGENISTVEVETVLYRHPAVLEAAVVARPDDHWGQTPCAFVKLKDGVEVTSRELIDFCRDHLPHYMAPKTVVFQELPKTSTGKIQKFILREKAQAMGSLS
ncbi:butanoate--CoA ligase AAE1-like [Andrographis paniculata]|uniref:butanoate--CoA ligase AAE1-like n=1 Tax=Andrographis paniculata TaxID=175694 RepID=UPI0021E96171|nr:butanoate--CoA ligase AAE1-like [Andrographis paniculata]